MACTRTIFQSLQFTRPFLGYQPLLIGGQEPALTAASMVKQLMLSAPCRWRWNRSEQAFETSGVQDYVIVSPTFGYIEKWLLTDAAGNTKEIQNVLTLAKESNIDRPGSAAILFDDNLGNLTVRLNNIPDQIYTVTAQFQRKPRPMTSAASFWNPIPDELTYITDAGFLAMACLIVKDARYPIFRQSFASHVMAAQDGLDETQKNIFMRSFLDSMRDLERGQIGTQLAVNARQY